MIESILFIVWSVICFFAGVFVTIEQFADNEKKKADKLGEAK